MKVLQDNRPEKQFVFPLKVTCMHCKSLLEAEESDLKKMGPDEMSRTNGYFYVQCPLCKTNTSVRPSGLTGSLQPTQS